MNEYGFHAEVIYEWRGIPRPASPPYQILSSLPLFCCYVNIYLFNDDQYDTLYQYNHLGLRFFIVDQMNEDRDNTEITM